MMMEGDPKASFLLRLVVVVDSAAAKEPRIFLEFTQYSDLKLFLRDTWNLQITTSRTGQIYHGARSESWPHFLIVPRADDNDVLMTPCPQRKVEDIILDSLLRRDGCCLYQKPKYLA